MRDPQPLTARQLRYTLAVLAVLGLVLACALVLSGNPAWGQPAQYPTLGHALYAAGYTSTIYKDINTHRTAVHVGGFNPNAFGDFERWGRAPDRRYSWGPLSGERTTCDVVNRFVRAGMLPGFNPPGWKCEDDDRINRNDVDLITRDGKSTASDDMLNALPLPTPYDGPPGQPTPPPPAATPAPPVATPTPDPPAPTPAPTCSPGCYDVGQSLNPPQWICYCPPPPPPTPALPKCGPPDPALPRLLDILANWPLASDGTVKKRRPPQWAVEEAQRLKRSTGQLEWREVAP